MTGRIRATSRRSSRGVDWRLRVDTVEKVAARFFQFSRAKIDLSDRPTNRSRMPVNGKKTPENLATKMASDFFNTIR